MKRLETIWKTLNIKSDEQYSFQLLYLFSFFNGLFLSFYFTPANALFVNNYSLQEMPYAYLGIGLVGYGLVRLFSHMQNRLSLLQLHTKTQVTLLGWAALVFILYYLFPGLSKMLAFAMFILVGPFFTFNALVFGGLFIQLFDISQSKRLFALANSGQVLASVLAFFITPILLRSTPLQTPHLLLFAVAGMAGALYYYRQIGRRFQASLSEIVAKPAPQPAEVKNKNPYIYLISLTAIVSAMAIYFIDYNFLGSIKSYFLPEMVSAFIALFFGFLKLAELALSFLSGRLLRQYGMRLGITLLPLLLLGSLSVAALSGILIPGELIIFFIFISFGKLIERVIRKTIDGPAFKVLYQPMPQNKKLALQTRVEGTLKQVGIGLSGLFLIFFTFWVDFLPVLPVDNNFDYRMLYFAWAMIPFLVVWVVLSFRLFNAYKEQLSRFLKAIPKQTGLSTQSKDTQQLLRDNIRQAPEKKPMSVLLLAMSQSHYLYKLTPQLLQQDDNPFVHQLLIRNMHAAIPADWLPKLKHIATNGAMPARQVAQKKWEALQQLQQPPMPAHQVYELSASPREHDQLVAVRQLCDYPVQNPERTLHNLLRSNHHQVIIAALSLSARILHPTLLELLIDYFTHSLYSPYTVPALKAYGDPAVEAIDMLFEREAPSRFLPQAIEVLKAIASTRAVDQLIQWLNYPDKNIQNLVASTLNEIDFEISNTQISQIKERIINDVSVITWYTATIHELHGKPNTLRLKQALDINLEQTYTNLFYLLGFIYDKPQIQLISRHINSSENIFALEIADNLIETDLKTYIIPLLEDLPAQQLLHRLEGYFPQMRLSLIERLKNILNYDFNKVDAIVKERAMRLLAKLSPQWLPNEIYAFLYHPNRYLNHAAVEIVYKQCTQYAYYLSKSSVIDQPIKDHLIGGYPGRPVFLADINKEIRRMEWFFGLPEKVLLRLAQIAALRLASSGQLVPVYQDSKQAYIIAVRQGQASFQVNGQWQQLKNNYLYSPGLNLPETMEYIRCTADSRILLFPVLEFFHIVRQEHTLLAALLHYPFNELMLPNSS